MLFRPQKGTFLDLKESLKKVQKLHFSKGDSPLFLSKNRTFYDLCFLANQARQDHFLIFWIKKKYAIKTKKREF